MKLSALAIAAACFAMASRSSLDAFSLTSGVILPSVRKMADYPSQMFSKILVAKSVGS